MARYDNYSLRIAYTRSGGAQWTGGLTYQKNLLTALQEYAPQVKVYTFSEQNEKNEELPARELSYIPIKYPLNNNPFLALINKFTLHVFGYNFLLAQTLKSIPNGNVNLVFPGRYSVGRGIAVLYWIPDFQYIHLPELYTKKQITYLGKQFKEGISRATLVVLSSRDAQKDYCKMVPQFEHKARVLSFVAHIPPFLYDTDPETIIVQYDLPKKFIYLPNQFWVHKNHVVVVNALRILKDRGVKPFIVFTGNTSDFRNPNYFDELMQKISLWGLNDQVLFLGLVPHAHVYSLIRQSICVINPSLFEGWSTTVEEVKSVGKRILLSDLAVHREQNPPAADYFDPNNAEDLAIKLEEIWANAVPGPDPELERAAREMFPTRMKNYADTFMSIACEAVNLVEGQSFLSTP